MTKRPPERYRFACGVGSVVFAALFIGLGVKIQPYIHGEMTIVGVCCVVTWSVIGIMFVLNVWCGLREEDERS